MFHQILFALFLIGQDENGGSKELPSCEYYASFGASQNQLLMALKGALSKREVILGFEVFERKTEEQHLG